MKLKLLSAVAASVGVLSSAASTRAVTISANVGPRDGFVWQNAVGDLFSGDAVAGELYNGGNQNGRTAAVYIFDLPALPTGEVVIGATFTARFLERFNGFAPVDVNYNIDLYGLNRISTQDLNDAEPITADWYRGDLDPSNALLLDNFVSAGPNTTVATTLSVSNAALVDFINQQYTAFGPLNDFDGDNDLVFIRLNTDGTSDFGFSLYKFGAANFDNQGSINRPTLTLETGIIPEPTVLAALIGGAVVVLRRRPI